MTEDAALPEHELQEDDARGTEDALVWLNGKILPESSAFISPRDHGFIVGDGVFEMMRVISGQAFALSRHVARLRNSARAIELTPPEEETVHAAVRELLSTAGLSQGRLRIVCSSGPGLLSTARDGRQPTLLIAAEEFEEWPPDVAVITAPWARNELGALKGVKSVSYAENVRALTLVKRSGAGEAIFANTRGELCEGSGTNVFVALNGKLITPPLQSGCLAGITRELLLEIVAAQERSLPLAALAESTEAFLTSATRGVQPIRSVDGTELPQCPGPLTRSAQRALDALIAKDLNP